MKTFFSTTLYFISIFWLLFVLLVSGAQISEFPTDGNAYFYWGYIFGSILGIGIWGIIPSALVYLLANKIRE